MGTAATRRGHRSVSAAPAAAKWRPRGSSSSSAAAPSPPGGVAGPAIRGCEPDVRPSAAAAPPSTSGRSAPLPRRPVSWSGRSKILGSAGRAGAVGRRSGHRGLGRRGRCRRGRRRGRGGRRHDGVGRGRGRRLALRGGGARGRPGLVAGGGRRVVRGRGRPSDPSVAVSSAAVAAFVPASPCGRAGVLSFPSTTTYPATCPSAGSSRPRQSPRRGVVVVNGSRIVTVRGRDPPAGCRRRRRRAGARGPRGPRPRCVTRSAARSTGTGARRSRRPVSRCYVPERRIPPTGSATHTRRSRGRAETCPREGRPRPWASVTDEWPS